MSNTLFSFAFLADPQIGMNSPFGLKGPGSAAARLDRAVSYINEYDINFAVLGGDQINQPDGPNTDAELDALEESLSRLTVPYYGVIGNHELGNPGERSKYVDRGFPVRFALSYENTYITGLAAAWIRGDFGKELEQKEWNLIETQLADAPSDCEHRFVVMHWPLFNYFPNEKDSYWNMPNRKELFKLFKKHNVSCVLSGHWQQDIDAMWDGISLITSVGTSMALQYPEELSFKVVTVFEGGWSVRRVAV